MTSREREELMGLLFLTLSKNPCQDKYQLQQAIGGLGSRDFSTSHINSVLYGNKGLFYHSEDKLPFWYAFDLDLADTTFHADVIIEHCDPRFYCGHAPREWQKQALEAWIKAGRRGVVEAVTGTGKTTLGVLAAADAVARGLDVLILVPGTDLMDQWHKNLLGSLPELAIGKFGDGSKDTLNQCNILVSTVQSARRNYMLSDGARGLIIADEVHGYGSKESVKALEPGFEDRLGLTATYERSDNKIEELLSPYFFPINSNGKPGDEVIIGCDYARGLADGILAPFRVALLGVDLEEDEQDSYDYFDERVRNLKQQLISNHECPAEPFGEFMASVNILSYGNHVDHIGTMNARNFLNNFNKRRQLLASSSKKLKALEKLVPVISNSDRCLIFTQTTESALKAAELLRNREISAYEFSSQLKKEVRKELLEQFRDGKIQALAAPRVLDEGIDVPEADLGIILSASHSKRQMIQRMGRIIRPKKDSKPATFIILYVRNTNEDPEYGIHEAFLNEMYDHAEDVFEFPKNIASKEIVAWYCQAKSS